MSRGFLFLAGIRMLTFLKSLLRMHLPTLRYAKKLEEVGFTREQAEMSVSIISEVIETNLATREDMKDLRHDMRHLESRLTIKLGAMVITASPFRPRSSPRS